MFQLLAYGMASPHLYADVQHGLLRELAVGGAGAYDRQHVDLHSLLDVPAELFLQMLEWVLGPAPWSDGAPVLAGRSVSTWTRCAGAGADPGSRRTTSWSAAARRTASAAGCRGIQPAAVTVPGGRHHDLFTGPGFTGRVAPELRRFYAALDR